MESISRPEGGWRSRWISGLPWKILAVLLAGFFTPTAPAAVEPGMEEAVNWKWRVLASERDRRTVRPAPTPRAAATPVPTQVIYEVQRGDALAIIARKFGLSIRHIKEFNGLSSDLIHIGDEIRIPTPEEAIAIAPLPKPKTRNRKHSVPGVRPLSDEQMRHAAVQVFLDRQNFSTGPIDGQRNQTFDKVLRLFRLARPDLAEPGALPAKVESELGDGFTKYVLTAGDFRFISPPKAAAIDRSHLVPGSNSEEPKVSLAYEDLVNTPRLDYRTPWEFVAERFHCDENFLKSLNAHLPAVPGVGTELVVPDVEPFEIELLGTRPLQAQPDPNLSVRAAIIDQALLQIFENDKPVAVMPVAMARPGLRGRGYWTILDAVLMPRLGTVQERRASRPKPKPLFGQPSKEDQSSKSATLAEEQYLEPGPNNPVGIAWIDLAKSGSTEPLPYGLHGTSIPDAMQTTYSLGGIQMANWNIVRAARRLPVGTKLEWTEISP